MKYKLLRFSLLSIFAMLFGIAHADYEKVTATSDITDGDYLIVYEAGNVAFNGALETLDATSNTVAVEIAEGKIASSADVDAAIFTFDTTNGTVKSASGHYIGISANNNGLKQTDEASTYTHTFSIDNDGNAVIEAVFEGSTMSLRFNSASNQARFRYYKNAGQQAIQLYKKVAGETPVDTRIATTVTVGEDQTGTAGSNMELPIAVVNDAAGAPIEGAVVVWSSSNEQVAKVDGTVLQLLAAGEATITATYDGDNTYKGSRGSFKVTVTAAPIDETFTSLKALQEAVTATSTPVTIQFNDVFVTAVKGSNAYLADAQGYGILVYTKDHGLEAGQVLNGTIEANLLLYKGQTEITGFSTEGLTITTTELTPTEKTIDAITAANQSTLVTLKGVTYSSGKLSDGTNEITYYDNFSAGSLEEGATYDITGIVILYNTTIEIAPRTADDIVKTSADPVDERLDLTLSFPQESYEATMGEDFEEPVLSGKPDEYDGMISYKSSDASVATVSYEGEVTLVAPGTVTITAEAMASQKYKEAEASYTLIVNERETPPEPEELANPYSYTFESKVFDTKSQTMTLNAANWNIDVTCEDADGYFGYDSTKGQQFGSGSKPATAITLSTADIPGTITKVVVNTSGAKDIDATFSVNVGETAFQYADETEEATTSVVLTKDATEYAFTGSASGTIILSWANNSAKAIYVKSIYVEYTNEEEEGYVYRDFAVQLTNTNIFDTSVNNFGVKVAEDGTYTAVAADDATANFVVNSTRFNDGQHGWVNCVFTIPVQGAVKIELGDCQYGGQNGTITDSEGNQTEIKANATKACWSPNAPHDNVVVAYYAGTSATTLTVSYNGYCPFIAVTSIDPSEIPSEATLTFDVANAGADGVAPAAQKVEIGSTVTIPANTTLYKEGYTLTAWADATGAQYAAGAEVTVSEDMTLMPVFTENTVNFADRTAETTITWQFGEGNGAGPLNAQGKSTILIAQATIGESVIDVKMDIDATNGKINNVGRGDEWAQCNDGTILTIPAYKGTQVSFRSYGDAAGTTIGGVEATDKAATYTGTAETLDIVAKGISYISNVVAVYPVPEQEVEPTTGFKDFAVNLTDASVFDTSVNNFGVKIAEDGSYSATTADDETANFTVNAARFNDAQHGWVNCVFTVPVEGPVKVGLGNCQYGTQDGTITDAEGNTTALTVGNANCWHNDTQNNISYTIYKGLEATTLTITYNGYCPFISVEKVDPAELKSDATVAFSAGEAENALYVPEAITNEVGKTITLPKNYTMYVEGKTLTAWSDGENEFAPGTEYIVPENDVTLTAVFTANEVNLADRTEAITVKWNFRRDQGAPAVGWEGKEGLVWVAQAEVNGKTIDVPLPFSTAPGKFNNKNNNDWVQINNGTTFTVPSCKGATVSMEAYNEITTTTIDGQTDYTQGKTISYTIAGAAETVDVVIGDGSYYRYIQVVLPVVQSQGGGESYENEVAKIEWPFNDSGAVATYTAQPEGAFSTVAVNTGDLTITGVASRSADDLAAGISFIKFKPAGETKAVQWVAKPAAGLTFTPTKVSMWIQRFGTDAENGVTITAKVGEGEAITLGNFTAPRANQGVEKDKYAKNDNWTNHVEIELTAEQQATLASGDELTLTATVGVGSSKEGGFSDVIIEGLVNGTKADVAMYTLTTAVAPEEAGSINVYPKADEYEEGSEVKLTATENFGYDFVNWTDAEGAVVSEEPVFTYTMNSNAVITANFQAVETYELALTVDGTNDYMVTVNPAPTEVDGKWMYEAGTAVQLNANQYEGLVTFTNWSDGETSSSKIVSMDGDIQLTALYAQADIIAGWDFYKRGAEGRKADFAAQDNDADALSLVNTESGETSGWLDKSTEAAGGYESFTGAAVNWRTGASNGDVGNWHWQTKINAEAFTDINVQFQMLYNYNAYQTYNAEYSLDGESWTKFGSITMEGTKAVAQFKEQLPAEANNQKDLFIRMLADKTSNVDGASSANDGNTLAMFFITGTPKLVDDGTAPVLVSTVPADGITGVSASGKIVLTFDERVKVAEGAVAYINNTAINSNTQNPTAPVVSGKTITFEYKGLEYASQYAFELAGNTVADLTDNFITEPISLTFTTMERPSVEKKMYDYVVENVEQLMAAIDAAQKRSDKNTRYRIFVKNGEYTIPLGQTMKTVNGYEVPECITFINTQNLSLIGESRDGVIITNGIDKNETFAGTYGTTSKYDGIGNSDVFQISGSDYYFQDLTIESGMDDATGRDLAVQDKATRTIYKNTGLRGYQDTWTSNNDNGLYYFEGGYVRGRTDFMCGKGDAFFNGVEIRQIYGGYAAVPSKSIKYGYTYKDCVINGEPGVAGGKNYSAADVDGSYTLGRPWGSGTPVALFIDTKMNVVPSAIGWNEMSGGYPKRFAEYNSMTSTGSVIDLSGRKKVFGDGHENNPVLTAEEALEAGNLHNMFGEWDPTLATEQAPIPSGVELNKDTKVLSWTDSNYALLYAIVKDGKVVDFTTEATYTVDDATATWAVRAANEMGGLGEAAEATVTTGISEIANGEQAMPETIYNINGIRVENAKKGLYIINGKKVVVK